MEDLLYMYIEITLLSMTTWAVHTVRLQEQEWQLQIWGAAPLISQVLYTILAQNFVRTSNSTSHFLQTLLNLHN
jgi:hypothetical protein